MLCILSFGGMDYSYVHDPFCQQRQDNLEPGGFYLDRHLESKHLPLAGTKYGREEVDLLWGKLSSIAEIEEEGTNASGELSDLVV
jgi:hypothetical protein